MPEMDGFDFVSELRKLDAGALAQTPGLAAYFERIAARPAVRAALEAEGLSP